MNRHDFTDCYYFDGDTLYAHKRFIFPRLADSAHDFPCTVEDIRANGYYYKETTAEDKWMLKNANPQYGIRWEDLSGYIEEKALGRKLTKSELKRFVEKDIVTIQRR